MKKLKKMNLKEHSVLSKKEMKGVVGGQTYTENCLGVKGCMINTPCAMEGSYSYSGRCGMVPATSIGSNPASGFRPYGSFIEYKCGCGYMPN